MTNLGEQVGLEAEPESRHSEEGFRHHLSTLTCPWRARQGNH